eukprot:TRINITY_DN830_c0_g1_i3.p1 TRINITY_DN830_c0_g1~~TRINITY_DN830_c0_g1_i3.p1  ORF type:complete len:808 (+),score=366.56 TRINITY_DN830_c0_g1_i3:92-2515(+)
MAARGRSGSIGASSTTSSRRRSPRTGDWSGKRPPMTGTRSRALFLADDDEVAPPVLVPHLEAPAMHHRHVQHTQHTEVHEERHRATYQHHQQHQHQHQHQQQHTAIHPKRAMVGGYQPPMGQPPYDPHAAPSPVSHLRTHAVKITRPGRHNSKVYTHEQVCEVQNEVLQHLEELKRSIPPLISFTHKNADLFKSSHSRPRGPTSNPISNLRNQLTDLDRERAHIKGILNKLTPEKYDSLKHKMFDVVMRADKKDADNKPFGITSDDIAELVYDDAVTVKEFTELYAMLCHDVTRRQAELLNIQALGKTPFRRALVMKCQSEYESTGPQATAAKLEGLTGDDLRLMKHKLETRANNNIHFVGELFKRQLVTEKIIVDHVLEQLLVKEIDKLDDQKTLKVVQLFKTVGRDLDEKGRDKQATKLAMDRYFQVLKDVQLQKGTNRVGFLLQEVIELRENNWVPKSEPINAGPQRLHDLDMTMRQQEIAGSMTSRWVASSSPTASVRVAELTPDYVASELFKGELNDTVKKRILQLNDTLSGNLLRDVLLTGLSDADGGDTILKNLAQFLCDLDSREDPECALLAKVFSVFGSKAVKRQDIRWAAFGEFLNGLDAKIADYPTVAFASEAVGPCVLESKQIDFASLLPMLRCFKAKYLHTRILAWLLLHPSTSNAKAALEKLKGLEDFSEESIDTIVLMLDDDQSWEEKTTQLRDLGMDPGQTAVGFLMAEWIREGGVQGKYGPWSEKSKEEQDALKEGFGQSDNKDIIMAEVDGLVQLAGKVNHHASAAVGKLVKQCKEFLVTIKILSKADA